MLWPNKATGFMTISAQSIISYAQTTLLNDAAGVRWPAAELVSHLNEFQRECVRVRPDQTATMITVGLAAGHKQALPDNVATFIDIPQNASNKPISKVDLPLMDAAVPGWRLATAKKDIVHFIYNLKDPRVFLVYPPALSTSSVVMEAALKPVDVTASSATTATGNLSVQDDMYTPALNWVMFRALSKNAEHASQALLAAGYKAAHDSALGIESTAAITPKTGEN